MLYGRDEERAQIDRLLDAARSSKSGALVVRGEPGIGKTALLEDARERAEDMSVLSARGVETEAELPFAALHQLIRPGLDLIDRLPPPQAAALRGALGLGEGGADERFLVFAGCLSLLSELSEDRPVLCLVDDAHWLDEPSADALRFVARRLDAEGIVMLFGAREGDVRVFDAPEIPSLVLGGLDTEAAAAVLTGKAGIDAAAFVRDRLVERAKGNALALLEIPSALTRRQLAGDEPLPDALPLTGQVESVFLGRVRRLPEDTQRLLLVAAADDSEDVTIIARAGTSLGIDLHALDPAEAGKLVIVRGTHLEFRHPLVRSAVYEAAASSDRREAHRALADALAGDDEQADRRAWHLAASSWEPDESVVEALEQAAGRAEERAGYLAAARAFERAAELSADPASRGRRLAAAARCASAVGADPRAVALARRAQPMVDEPLLNVELARVLGLADIRCGRPADAPGMMLHAAREIGANHPATALELLLDASWAANEAGDYMALIEMAALAETLEVDPADGPTTFVFDLITGMGAIAERNEGLAVERLERAISWGAVAEDARHLVWAGSASLFRGDDRRASSLFERGAAKARADGALGALGAVLGILGLQHFVGQRLDQAAMVSREALEFVREVGADNLAALPLFVLAGVAAIRGDDEEALARAAEAQELSFAHGLMIGAARPVWALGLLDIGRGRWLEALQRLEAMDEMRLGMASAVAMTTMADRIEAATRAGELERGRKALGIFEVWAGHARAGWVPSRLACCRALMSEGDEATQRYTEALELADPARSFDVARIHLLFGEHLRREKRRIDARAHLRSALERFEQLKAEPWAERARAELRASGETARKRDPSTIDQLTPQELQIARYVAEGLSNKEVAAQLFLSPRTIDSHLRRVFAKLEITSRTQLARIELATDVAA